MFGYNLKINKFLECEDDAAIGEPAGSQLKVVGRLADQCQDALVQLGTFLASSHAPDEYAARLPSLQVLFLFILVILLFPSIATVDYLEHNDHGESYS